MSLILLMLKVGKMLEVLASIGIVGSIIILVGVVLIFWLAKIIDETNNYEGNDDE
jgi:hypothetical protein